MTGKALVLGGGGVTGIAWELGILAGLAEDGVDLTDADVIVGTSAGSVVRRQLTSGIPVEELYQRQLEPPTGDEIAARIKLSVLARWAMASLGTRDPQRARAQHRRHGAGRPNRAGESERREVFESRLSIRQWPTHPKLLVTAIAADDGEFVVWDRDSGVSLVDAVMSSCAVPGVWPPVTSTGAGTSTAACGRRPMWTSPPAVSGWSSSPRCWPGSAATAGSTARCARWACAGSRSSPGQDGRRRDRAQRAGRVPSGRLRPGRARAGAAGHRRHRVDVEGALTSAAPRRALTGF